MTTLDPKKVATLTLDEKTYSFPVLKGTLGPDVIDITTLYNQSDCFTFDPAFLSTASCESKITYIDGDQGILLYRGYDIRELARHSTFLEVSYLLLHGHLPTAQEHSLFTHNITSHTLLHEQLINFYKGFRRDAHPMAVMVGVVGALSAFYHNSLDIKDQEQRLLCCHQLIAKMPTIAAMAYKYSVGHPFVYPQNHLDFTSNFLHMLFAVPSEPYVVNPVMAQALDRIFILHADHEQNASTSTVRLVGSTGANPFACVSAGIAALWGPAHGGANEAALKMLDQIGTKENIQPFLEKVKKKNTKLMGFGHRVYKNYDPRAAVLRDSAYAVLAELKSQDPFLEMVMELERTALEDPYFVERKLFPNVDFYSGIILRAMGIPASMFTVLFAVARTVGWVAQWMEMLEDPKLKIARPRQLYRGPTQRTYTPLNLR